MIWWKTRSAYLQNCRNNINLLPRATTRAKINAKNYSAMVIYITCREHPFPARRLEIPSLNLPCNKSLNYLPCKEAFTMLDFIIEYYDNFSADKLIFIHGHEHAWHYKTSVVDAINRLIKTNSFISNDYGGIYRNGWHYHSVFTESNQDGLRHQEIFKEVFHDTTIFKYFRGYNVSFPCCSTFYIDTALINYNPLSLYKLVRERLKNWTERELINNQRTAIFCGYFMEFAWSILFNHPYVSPSTAIVD